MKTTSCRIILEISYEEQGIVLCVHSQINGRIAITRGTMWWC